METTRLLLISGVLLLAAAALMGFLQYRHRDEAEAFARWRVVHNGGTAGGVQLLALAAVWDRLGFSGNLGAALAAGLVVATWAFFLGPLARALGSDRTAGIINALGALVAAPAYLGLPLALLG